MATVPKPPTPPRRAREIVDPDWSALEPVALLAVRLLVGGFLIWGVWDNIVDPARMDEFSRFLKTHGFPAPSVLAPLSVYAQCLCGLAFISGVGLRWAGLVCAFNFAVAVVMVDAKSGVRAAFPAALLVVLGLYFATRGAGRWAVGALRR